MPLKMEMDAPIWWGWENPFVTSGLIWSLSDMVLSCPSTADVQTAMNKFMNEIHTAQMEGDLNQETLCS